MKKGSQQCPALPTLGPSSPKAGWGTAGPNLHSSQLPKRKLPWAPQTVKCQLRASGTRLPALTLPGPFSLGPAAS